MIGALAAAARLPVVPQVELSVSHRSRRSGWRAEHILHPDQYAGSSRYAHLGEEKG